MSPSRFSSFRVYFQDACGITTVTGTHPVSTFQKETMKKLSMILSFVCLFAVLATTAFADAPSPLTSVSSWSGLVTVTNPQVVPVEFCDGVDGQYALLSVKGSGPMVTNDPRLAGTFNVDALILDSPTNGYGVSVDNWTITDANGTVMVQGRAIATDLGPNPRAVSYGQLADGSIMVANTLVTLPRPGSTDPLTIAYGVGPTPIPDRGVVLSGHNRCTQRILRAMTFGH